MQRIPPKLWYNLPECTASRYEIINHHRRRTSHLSNLEVAHCDIFFVPMLLVSLIALFSNALSLVLSIDDEKFSLTCTATADKQYRQQLLQTLFLNHGFYGRQVHAGKGNSRNKEINFLFTLQVHPVMS